MTAPHANHNGSAEHLTKEPHVVVDVRNGGPRPAHQ
jgi:hypothetical protein